MRQSLSHRGPDFGANHNRILLSDEQTAIATERKADTLRERGRETYSGEEVHRGYTVERGLAGVAVTNEIEWVVDSGCMNHITGNRNAFVKETYVSLSAHRCQMNTATGELVSAAGIGTVQTYTWTPGGGRERLFLTEVLYVPGATEAGLISVSQLTKKGVKIAFTISKNNTLRPVRPVHLTPQTSEC